MLNYKQIAVIGFIATLMGLLLSMPIKSLVKEQAKGQAKKDSTTSVKNSNDYLTLQDAAKLAKKALPPNIAKEIESLESELSCASGAEALGVKTKLAMKWESESQLAPAAFYRQAIAEQQNTYDNWIKSGNDYMQAYQSTQGAQDTAKQITLLQRAIFAYQKALALSPKSLDAKVGLATAYVEGTSSPMQGISMLLEVLKEDPKNIKANAQLGLFSMKSGQYQKAIQRFKNVLAQQPTSFEAWFHLAIAYENLGMRKEAMEAYKKCKLFTKEAYIWSFIDKKINELKE